MGKSREEIYALVQSVLLGKNDDGSFRCLSEDEKQQQAKNFLECMAGESLPEGADPVELLEEICPGFSEQRDSLSTQMLNEAQQQ